MSKEVRAYLRNTEIYSPSKTCKLPQKRKVRLGRSEERKKYSKERRKILTGKGSQHQINGQREEGRERRKTSAEWSTVAMSNYKPKRDMSWQVDQ